MQILSLNDPMTTSALRLHTEGIDTHGEWSAAVRGAQPVAPLRAQQYTAGSQLRDFLWTGLGGTPTISDRVVALLHSHGISGWNIYPVELYDAAGRIIPGYSGLGITGRYTGTLSFDQRESAIVYVTGPSGKPFPHFRGLQFAPSLWDGSDLFMDTHGTGYILVTERVVKLFKKHKVNNCKFTRIEDKQLLALEREIIRARVSSGDPGI